jgi:hypothetical protein
MNTTIIEVEKETLRKFGFVKMQYQAKIQKKLTNDEFVQILLENMK